MFRSISQCPELEVDPTVKGEVGGHKSQDTGLLIFVMYISSLRCTAALRHAFSLSENGITLHVLWKISVPCQPVYTPPRPQPY